MYVGKDLENQSVYVVCDLFDPLFWKSEVFLEDQTNLELFNNKAISKDVTELYILQLFTFNPTFSPMK